MKTTLDIYGQLFAYEETTRSKYLVDTSLGVTVVDNDGYFIHVHADLNPRMKSQTIIHELCHAVMTVGSDWNGEHREEQIASMIGSGLFYVLLVNVDFTKYLMSLIAASRKQSV